MKTFLGLGFILLFSGCLNIDEATEPKALPPTYVGIVRSVNRAEHYLIFEAEVRFPVGAELNLLRNSRKIGEARVLSAGERKFQAANIYEGAPRVGDLCEPKASVFSSPQTQEGQ